MKAHIRSLLGRVRDSLVRFVRGIKNFFTDPPLDHLAAAVFGQLIGRAAIYTLVLYALVVSHFMLTAALVLVCALMDLGIHWVATSSIVRLIRMEMLTSRPGVELSSDIQNAFATGVLPFPAATI